jgi:hypothetical protein
MYTGGEGRAGELLLAYNCAAVHTSCPDTCGQLHTSKRWALEAHPFALHIHSLLQSLLLKPDRISGPSPECYTMWLCLTPHLLVQL